MKQIKTGPAEPPHIRARHEAQDADNIYRGAVRRLDRQRLALEDRIEESLKLLQRWEIDRLRAIKDGVFYWFHCKLLVESLQFFSNIMRRCPTCLLSFSPLLNDRPL